jgi:broad specificity polyphosphatase/5'/3'-nucleotidase SurE
LDVNIVSDFGFAARFSRRIIAFRDKHGLSRGTALNVNIPAIPEDRITITPITFDLTDHIEAERLASLAFEF